MRLSFTVPGPPVPLARARRDPRTRFWFTPHKSRVYKSVVAWHGVAAVRHAMHQSGSTWPLDAEYGMSLWAYAKDHRKRDWSNILKGVEDALIGVLWNDDSQIRDYGQSGLRVDGEAPRAEVRVWVLSSTLRGAA